MIRNLLFICVTTSLLTGCIPDKIKEQINQAQEQANQQFGDQHFKTAIALIELHKVRFGKYPESLNDLKYLGDWDKMFYQSVKYERLEDGYSLDLVNGWMGKPEDLSYPDEFWNGTGIRKSNLKK